MTWTLILLVLGMNLVIGTSGYSHTDVNNLYEHLFTNSGYNKHTRPVRNQSEYILIDLNPGILALESYDLTSGYVAIRGYYYISWRDELLVWNSSDFNGIEKITIPSELPWLPDLRFLDAKRPMSLTRTPAHAYFLASDGSISMYAGGFYESKCDTKTLKYPLDFHTCKFSVLINNYGSNEVKISTHAELDIQKFSENDEWSVNQGSCKVYQTEQNGANWSVAEASFVITRRPAFVFMHDFTSISLLCWLNAFTCLVPCNSGERLSFSVTLFLAYSVQSSQVSNTLPKNAVTMVPFSLCITISNIFCALGTIWSVCIVRMANMNHENYPIPGVLKSLHRYKCCKAATDLKSNRKKNKRKIKPEASNTNIKLDDLDAERENESKSVMSWVQSDDVIDAGYASDNDSDLAEVTWLHISETLDKIFFIIITTVLSLFYICFFLVITMF